jgi:nicotinate phosphoribosyltransferase
LVATKESGDWEPRIKLSSNPAKMTDPGRKRLTRYFDAEGHPLGDVMYTWKEEPPGENVVPFVHRTDLNFVHPLECVASAEELLVPLFDQGRRLEPPTPLTELRRRSREQVASLAEEFRRLRNPERYTVGLSPCLAELKADLVRQSQGVL